MIKNLKEHILVITSFPSRGAIHSDLAGVASYAKNTLQAIQNSSKNRRLSIEVFAEKTPNATDYKEKGITVRRLWKRSSFSTFPLLLKEIIRNRHKTNIVLIEFEFSMFGTFSHLLLFPIFLVALKLLRKKIIFVCHQVLLSLDEIAPHINLEYNSAKTGLFNVVIKWFYYFIIRISSKVIVFEDNLKDRLMALSSHSYKRKIAVIPHGVQEFKNTPNKDEARKKVGIGRDAFVVMSFGFLAWYKGTDWLIHAINEIKNKKGVQGKNIELVLAGGQAPNHKNKEYYKRYIKGIMKACQENNFMLTGFIDEKEIPLYFKAADLVILPYRTFMSSSGPLSFAFSFKKPFLLSPKLKGILGSEDLKDLLSELRLKEEDISFKDFNGDLESKLIKLRGNTRLRQRLARLSNEARKARSWEVIGERYYKEIVN